MCGAGVGTGLHCDVMWRAGCSRINCWGTGRAGNNDTLLPLLMLDISSQPLKEEDALTHANLGDARLQQAQVRASRPRLFCVRLLLQLIAVKY